MAVSPVRALLVLSTLSALASPVAAQKGGAKPAPAPAPAPAEGPPGYAEALARYQELLARKSFDYHTEGRTKLAETKSAEALQVLAADYTKPKSIADTESHNTKMTAEYIRYTLATLIGRHFDKPEDVLPLDALRLANAKPVDTWLWVQALRIAANRGNEAQVQEIALTSKIPLQRAAAIAAIGASSRGDLSAVVLQNCIEFPKKESERAVLLGAMTGAIWDQRSRVNSEDYRNGLKAYIGLLGDDVGLSHTLKVQMGRHLQWILNGPALFVNAEPWLELLARGDVKKPTDNGTTAAPRFFGIETDGERICYVVDMSDSMLIEIGPDSKPSTGPITGQKATKKKALFDESDLPWNKIQTRWDLAREQLKISLWRLTPDKHFAVVWFGDKAGTLDSAKGLIKATRANVDRVVAELDGIKAHDPAANRPSDGVMLNGKRQVLKGDTNMHAGLRLAFGLAGKGSVDEAAYVDPDALTEGCDTIFLLSDGAPTVDDFLVNEKYYKDRNVVKNLETKEAAPTPTDVWASGPFNVDPWIVDDVRRMNAFRRITMHCIGLGEANEGLLNNLVDVCHGKVFIFGQKKGAAKK